MRKAAEAGRGSFTFIGETSEVAARIGDLFRKLERPVLTDVLTTWSTAAGDGLDVEAYPKLAPDLYDGEPVVLVARLAATAAAGAGTELRLSGVFAGRQWRHVLRLADARHAAAPKSPI